MRKLLLGTALVFAFLLTGLPALAACTPDGGNCSSSSDCCSGDCEVGDYAGQKYCFPKASNRVKTAEGKIVKKAKKKKKPAKSSDDSQTPSGGESKDK